MKKNLISVVILALVFANFVLTALLMFSVLPETKKANTLIEKVCSAIDLDLNSGAAGRILLIDLDEKPGSSEEFFAALETYCKKSSITLEYVKRDIPATVKLNGRLHTVTLTESYMYGGPGWSMEIQEIL